ncbi:MAG: hypothetical protein JJ863_29665 [Deltaproteobacteria bacterium]|nr:hypothetical protein [Deltaproteobacteria bacterium]
MRTHLASFFASLLALSLACGDDDGGDTDMPDGSTMEDADVDPGPATVRFDLDGSLDATETFFDFPFPSDLRLRADGTPNLEGYPVPGSVEIIPPLLAIAQERQGWPTIPVGMFHFSAPIAPVEEANLVPADASSPLLLIDVDPDSPERGKLYPVVGRTFRPDFYTQTEGFLSVGPRPGFVLPPSRTYAFVVTTALEDARGRPLEVNEDLATLAAGETPSGARGADAQALYAPLWETLDTLGVGRDTVAAATVFTTGDVVREVYELSERVRDAFDVTIDSPALSRTQDRYCDIRAEIDFPQFQRGTPPFDEEGTFEFDGDGLPIEQRTETAKLVLTIPREPMPEAGYPLMVYFHGSGGIASQVVDRGTQSSDGSIAAGEGPAHVIAAHGFAAAGASLPLSPDRLPGAAATEYLNLENLAAFRDTFRQGVLEQRLMLDALIALEIDPSEISCDGAELPAGETMIRFDPDSLVALGQSMGGMYTNMIGAVEPRFEALVPTGAGGHWSYFILETSLIPGVGGLLGSVLRVRGEELSFMHPIMHLLAIGWEAAEPFVYMPRLSRRPLEGFTPRPVYEPVGMGDSYFPIAVYDAVALSYGHPQAGEEVWPSMQDALALAGLDGTIDYPVSQNLTSETGEDYTGAVVQYAGDGFSDPHVIFVQLDEVKYQYGCFLETQVRTGTAVIPAPAALGTPCPTAE